MQESYPANGRLCEVLRRVSSLQNVAVYARGPSAPAIRILLYLLYQDWECFGYRLWLPRGAPERSSQLLLGLCNTLVAVRLDRIRSG
jgi:hypothetical protein